MEAKASSISLDHDLLARFERIKSVAGERLREAAERYQAAVEIANINGDRSRQLEWIKITKERRDRLEEMLDGKGKSTSVNRMSKGRPGE